MKIKAAAIFCGSSAGKNNLYGEMAYSVGEHLAKNGITVVYGGANRGLMKHVADGALDHAGQVIGVMPEFLNSKEVAYDRLKELIIVKTMHERKWRMAQLCDAVIALPGGYGTLDEFFEMLTWGQLGLHGKPLSLLNVAGYFTHLLAFADRMVEEDFLKQSNRDMLLVAKDIDSLLEKLKQYQPHREEKWIKEPPLHD